MARPLHPLAVASIEAWLATLPEEVRRAGAGWERALPVIALKGSGVGLVVEWVRLNTYGSSRRPARFYFPGPGTALIRQLRCAALLDIAEHEPTQDELTREARRQFSTWLGEPRPLMLLIAERYFARRRRAAMRLLMLDERAMMTEGATYSDAGWATATLPPGSGAVHERLEYAVIGGAT